MKISPEELSSRKAQNKQKEKSVAEQVEELLRMLSHDELKAFIHDTCVSDNKFRQLFVAKHIHYFYPESKELYINQLRALVKSYSDKHGFIDYQNAKRLGGIVSEMAEGAMNDLTKGQTQKALFIALAIIEEMVDLISHSVDDSNGQIGGSIEEAFFVLETLTGLDLNKIQHDELFDSLLALFENSSLKGWDWHFHSITLATGLIRTDQEKDRIKSALEKIKPNGKSWDWEYRQAQELMLKLIRKTESHGVAVQFIEDNVSNPKFRAELIEKALVAKDYAKVKHLAYEGIANDEKVFPGLANDWRNYLLTVYQQTGDVENTIQSARYFFMHSNGHRHPLKYYYELLKSLVPHDQWSNYLSGLIDDIKKGNRWIDYDRISQLYIWEECWDKLFALLQQNPGFERIISAEPYLAESYSNELATLYRKLILTYLEGSMGREYYQSACRYIQRMIKLGARSMAEDLVRELKVLYPTRRALLEELSKV